MAVGTHFFTLFYPLDSPMTQNVLAFDPVQKISHIDWLTFPEQILLSLTAGRVYVDEVGELTEARQKLSFYPQDIWLYLMACQWKRIAQEEAFMGRCCDVGDDLGSRLVASRLVRHLMKLCFFIEKKYAPYSKWFGTAFSHLKCSSALSRIIIKVFDSPDWRTRDKHLSEAFRIVATMHNDLAVTTSLDANVTSYHGRPYLVLHSDRFVDALRAVIQDPRVKEMETNMGSINQFIDSTQPIYSTGFSQIQSFLPTELNKRQAF